MVTFSPKTIAICLWLAVASFWAVRAFGNKKTVRRHSLRSRFFLARLAAAAAIYFGIRAGHGFFAHPFVPDTVPTAAAGLALTLAGMGLAIWARLIIGRNWSGLVTLKQDHILVTRGPYAFMRHPIYTGLLLAMLGTAIVFRETGGLALTALVFALLILKSRLEEQLMADAFGDAYRAYRRRVKAFIPFVF